LISKNIFSLF